MVAILKYGNDGGAQTAQRDPNAQRSQQQFAQQQQAELASGSLRTSSATTRDVTVRQGPGSDKGRHIFGPVPKHPPVGEMEQFVKGELANGRNKQNVASDRTVAEKLAPQQTAQPIVAGKGNVVRSSTSTAPKSDPDSGFKGEGPEVEKKNGDPKPLYVAEVKKHLPNHVGLPDPRDLKIIHQGEYTFVFDERNKTYIEVEGLHPPGTFGHMLRNPELYNLTEKDLADLATLEFFKAPKVHRAQMSDTDKAILNERAKLAVDLFKAADKLESNLTNGELERSAEALRAARDCLSFVRRKVNAFALAAPGTAVDTFLKNIESAAHAKALEITEKLENRKATDRKVGFVDAGPVAKPTNARSLAVDKPDATLNPDAVTTHRIEVLKICAASEEAQKKAQMGLVQATSGVAAATGEKKAIDQYSRSIQEFSAVATSRNIEVLSDGISRAEIAMAQVSGSKLSAQDKADLLEKFAAVVAQLRAAKERLESQEARGAKAPVDVNKVTPRVPFKPRVQFVSADLSNSSAQQQ